MADKAVAKKPNIFVRMGKGIAQFFRSTRSEVKKIVWPSKKQVLNNFAVVAVFVVLAAALIAGLDALFRWLFSLLTGLLA